MKRPFVRAASFALISVAAAVLPGPTQAAPSSTPNASATAPVDAAAQAPITIPGVKAPDVVRSSPVPGIYEVHRGAEIIYMTADGRYVFTGDLYQVANHADVTEARRRELRRVLIAAVPESEMVVFSPPDPKYTITVFTDVDCTYCRAFHRQIADYNRLGVRVRYVFFPRTGPNTPSWFKAEQVWCSSDRQAALTHAKLGEPLDTRLCPNTPVARGYELGKEIGLEGTPGIVASNGTLVGGYLPPDELVAQLKQLDN